MGETSHGKVVTTLLLSALLVAGGASADPVIDAVAAGKPLINIRTRYESVDVPLTKDADALTVRTRLGWQTGEVAGFWAVVELTDNQPAFGVNDYAPEKSGYAVVADPERSGIDRAFLAYSGVDGLTLAGGRQRIIYDNARFIGNVGWRQTEQTFDSFTAVWQPLDKLTVNYAFIKKVHGITQAFDAHVTDNLFNVSYSGIPGGTLVGYSYLLHDDDTNTKNDSYGARFSGSSDAGGFSILYALEYAHQKTDNFDANYAHAEFGFGIGKFTATAAYELLGSDNGKYGFQTPLATKHAFNGWADRFLVTPADGLVDAYLDLSAVLAGTKFSVIYHDFSADHGGDNYGGETDLLAAHKFGKHYTVGAKYAAYRADSNLVSGTANFDIDKFWVWFEFSY